MATENRPAVGTVFRPTFPPDAACGVVVRGTDKTVEDDCTVAHIAFPLPGNPGYPESILTSPDLQVNFMGGSIRPEAIGTIIGQISVEKIIEALESYVHSRNLPEHFIKDTLDEWELPETEESN